MKKLLLLAMILGLTGCGDNNQSDTQTNTLANNLQKADTAPKYRMAVSPQSVGAVAPLAGWSITQSFIEGASTLINAVKDSKVSAALITPNAKQVAEVLRGGAAGIALTIAVDQLLGAVDWVMDPANNRIVYKVQPAVNPNIPRYWVTPDKFSNPYAYGYATPKLACNALLGKKVWATSPIVKSVKDEGINPNNPYISGCLLYKDDGSLFGSSSVSYEINPAYDPKKQPEEKYLPLETVAEQVISNADSGSLDAQVATNIAAQNILNDVVQAEPVVQELENNANCPSGIMSQKGQCWICNKEDYAPVTQRTKLAKAETSRLGKCLPEMENTELFTRINAFNEFIQARVNENSCWAPLDPGHIQQEQDGRNGVLKCTKYLK